MKNNLSRILAWCVLVTAGQIFPLRADYTAMRWPPGSTRPVGEKPHALKPADWEGTWIFAEHGDLSAWTVTVTDAAKGRLQVGRIEMNGGKPELQTGIAEVREAGGWLFINLGGLDDGKEFWFWGRIKFQADLLLVWAPNADHLKELSRQGKLKCRLSEGGSLLEPLTPEDMKVLTADELVVPFDWNSPGIFRRGRAAR